MKIDLNSFSDFLIVDGEETVRIPHVYNLENSVVKVGVRGRITKVGDGCRFIGEGFAVITFNCDKCLDTVEKEINFDINELIVDSDVIISEKDRENDVWQAENHKFNLMDCVMPNLFAHLPMKVYCREDCEGLCPNCGKNLNNGDCGCEKKASDPRFDVLRSLFDDKEV